MLKYSLVENWLTARPDAYSAQARSTENENKEAIVTRMLNKSTQFKRTEILEVLNNFEDAVIEALIEGNAVNLPLFNTLFSISGVFEGAQDSFDSERHKLNINLTKGVLLREAESKVKFEKAPSILPHPHIQDVRDILSRTVNEKLTANGVIEVRGHHLKIAGDNPACGLWFVGSKGLEIKAEVLIENKPSQLLVLIPDLVKDKYQLKVVSQHTVGGRVLKHPKVFVYPKSLRLVANSIREKKKKIKY